MLRSQPVTDPALNAAVQQLESWRAGRGAAQGDRPGSHTYTHADAVRIMDAWWPKLIEAEFRPGPGRRPLRRRSPRTWPPTSPRPPSHGPSGAHSGSAFQYGWWGFADKDLRQVLGQPVKGPLAKTYCGGGDLSACRSALLSTLKEAAAVPAARSTRATTAARPASSGAPTRSSTARWAGSRRSRSTGRTGRRTSRSWSSPRTADVRPRSPDGARARPASGTRPPANPPGAVRGRRPDGPGSYR